MILNFNSHWYRQTSHTTFTSTMLIDFNFCLMGHEVQVLLWEYSVFQQRNVTFCQLDFLFLTSMKFISCAAEFILKLHVVQSAIYDNLSNKYCYRSDNRLAYHLHSVRGLVCWSGAQIRQLYSYNDYRQTF